MMISSSSLSADIGMPDCPPSQVFAAGLHVSEDDYGADMKFRCGGQKCNCADTEAEGARRALQALHDGMSLKSYGVYRDFAYLPHGRCLKSYGFIRILDTFLMEDVLEIGLQNGTWNVIN